ncbi:MAG: OadG family protein [Anaerocolumna sp.]
MNDMNLGNILAADFNLYVWEGLPKEVIITLLGLGTVFAALIIIFGIVAILKLLVKLTASGSQSSTVSNKNVNLAKNTSSDNIELSSNPELVAVITAAIMASMGEENHGDTDGFVVRSIRKKRNTGWN